MKRLAIIGGGMTGLSMAHFLKDRYHIDIYDKDGVGGLVGWFGLEGDGYLEKFYHHFFTSDLPLLNLITEMGLEKEIITKKTRMGFYMDGGLYDFSTPLDILMFKPLSIHDRMMLAVTTLYLVLLKDWAHLEGITCGEFFGKAHAKSVFDKIWKPLLISKFGDAYGQIPMSWLWGRVSARGKSRKGSNETLLYINGGFKTLFERLLDELGGKSIEIKVLNVGKIERTGDGFTLNDVFYDKVVYTGPGKCLADIMDFGGEIDHKHKLNDIDYQGVVCAIFVLDRRLSDYYWLNVVSNEILFSGVIEHTNFQDPANYGGKKIAYLFNYAHRDSQFYKKTDTEILDAYKSQIVKVFPHINEKNILEAYIHRQPFANPIYPLNYTDTKPPYHTPVKNLYLCNMTQIYPEDRNLSNSIRIAKEAADLVLRQDNISS
jgi:protoporphyrinogen oxidase